MLRDGDENDAQKLVYIPSHILMNSEIFKYDPKPPTNLNYVSAEELKTGRLFKEKTMERINMAVIA